MFQKLSDMLTERNNSTLCPVRVSAFLTGAVYHVAAVAGFWFNQIHLDATTLGLYIQHMALLSGTVGVAVSVKSAGRADAP